MAPGAISGHVGTNAVTVDAFDAPKTEGAPAPKTPNKPTDVRRGFARRHPWLTGLLGVVGLFFSLILAVVLFLSFADWNAYRAPLARWLSAQAHRHVQIDGDLKVRVLTLTPTLSVEGLKVANPKWAGPGDTADIQRLVIQVRLFPLIIGRVVSPLVELDHPILDLRRDESGRETWTFGGDAPNKKPFRLPPIQHFIVNQGHLQFTDEKRLITVSGVIDSNEQATGPQSHAFSLVGQGSINKNPFHLTAAGGPLLNLHTQEPYPFTAELHAGLTTVKAVGHLRRPFDFSTYTTNLAVSGPDLADLYFLTGLALPNTPTYALKGLLTRKPGEYDLDKVSGKIGDSDLEGAGKVKISAARRPLATADLHSQVLDIRDLATLFGAPPVGKALAAATQAQKVQAKVLAANDRILPNSTLAVGRLRGMDAALSYHAASVTAAFVPISGASLSLTLDHGLLTVDPVAFNFPQGRLSAKIDLDARSDPPVTDVDLRLSNLTLQEFLPKTGVAAAALEGVMAARIRLRGRGSSVRAAAGASDGAITVVIPHGKIRTAFAELLGVNAGKGLSLLLAKNNGETNIRCAVANFSVTGGIAKAQDVVFDTDVVRVKGTGDIDLGAEALDLTLKGDSKQFRVTHLLLPITIKGHLRDPKLGVNPTATLAQGATAVALGVAFTPLAAVLPFVDPGLAKNADCAALMTEAQTDAAPVRPSQGQGLKTTPSK